MSNPAEGHSLHQAVISGCKQVLCTDRPQRNSSVVAAVREHGGLPKKPSTSEPSARGHLPENGC